MDITIREATVEDLNGLDRLMSYLIDEPVDIEKSKGNIEKIHKSSNSKLLIAFDNDEKIAAGTVYGALIDDYAGNCRPLMVIENVSVLPEYHGNSIGRRLMDSLENWAIEMGASYAILVSGKNRGGAHKFYDRLGYTEEKGYRKYF